MKKRLITGAATAAVLAAVAPVTNNLIAQSPAAVQHVQASTVSDTFLSTAAKQAQKAAKKYGIYPSVMIAQAIIESNWGQSGLAVNANNLFGMKADDNWTGATYSSKTQEDNGTGKLHTITAKFRKYSSYEASFEDNGNKLRNGVSWQPTRYQGTWLENAASYKAATKALTGTYATDIHYNTTLNKQISTYNLTKYDPAISTKKSTYTVKKSGATYAWPTNHSVSAKSDSVTKGDHVTVTKTITYYNGTKRMYISGKGWINGTSIDLGNALPPASQAPKGNTKANKTLMHNAYIYDDKGKKVKGVKLLKADKVIATYGTKKIKGKSYYVIGDGKNIAANNIDGKMRILQKNAYVYNDYANRDNKLVYKKNNSVATYGSAVTIYGKKYYKIGINQYIKKNNF